MPMPGLLSGSSRYLSCSGRVPGLRTDKRKTARSWLGTDKRKAAPFLALHKGQITKGDTAPLFCDVNRLPPVRGLSELPKAFSLGESDPRLALRRNDGDARALFLQLGKGVFGLHDLRL